MGSLYDFTESAIGTTKDALPEGVGSALDRGQP
jgi:hypothetical protein